MSLINEALKKAQTDRPESSRPKVPMDPGGMPPSQPPPRKKRYLFSFIVVVLLVGLISAMVSTYLVFQILGDDDQAQASQESVQPTATKTVKVETGEPQQEATAAEPVATGEPPANQQAEDQVIAQAEAEQAEATTTSEEVTATPPPEAEELVIAVPDAVAEEVPSEPEPVAETTPVQPEVIDQQVAVDPAPPATQPTTRANSNTNPEIWRRLDEFEIRGIMSRGAKVLIYDSRTEKARTYTPGDLIDGALALRVARISSGEIQFTNNEGSIFTKAF